MIITLIPQPHGNHMHVGRRVVATKDATGLDKHAVWNALQRKGLAHGGYPYAIRLTAAGVTCSSLAAPAKLPARAAASNARTPFRKGSRRMGPSDNLRVRPR